MTAEPVLTLDPRQTAAFDLVASGALGPDAPLRLTGLPVTPPVGAVVTLRDLEGVTLGSLTVAAVEGDAVTGPLTVRQRHDRPDYPELWRSVADVAPLGLPAVVVTVPLDPADVAAVVDTARGRLLVLLLSDRPADDPAHHARVRAWQRLLAPYGERVLLVLVPAPDTTSLDVRERIAASFGAPALLPTPTAAARTGAEPVSADRPGVTVFFTGLSGSGKSTIAGRVLVRLLAAGVTTSMLDGDVVRTHLSKGLGFSREDRDTNVRRIGWVAAEITKHGGFAVAAPIAPYAATRRAVRSMVEAHGVFVLVHVATPLEVCEQRDRKGLYAKARAGEIPEFTGVSDPYEEPDDADLVIDTQTETADAAADRVIGHLHKLGVLPDVDS